MEKRRRMADINRIGSISNLRGYINEGVYKLLDANQQIPERGLGSRSAARAVERAVASREQVIFDPIEAKKRRRLHNVSLYRK